MTGHTSELYNTEMLISRFDIIIEWLLIALLAFMPLAFGVVHAWSEEIVITLSAAITICFMLKFICRRNDNVMWTLAYLPVGTFLFVVILQLVPLPVFLLRILSPNTAAIKTELLGSLADAKSSMTLSFYPNATKHDLLLVMSAAVVFIVVFNIFRHPDQIKRLLTAISLIGGVVALIALGQTLFGNGKIYWFIASQNTKGYSGPFVNHSHYGQFMNLSIGAALALIMVKLHEDFARCKKTPVAVFDYLSAKASKPVWLMAAIITFGAASIFTSLTRSGMLSMLIASAITTFLFTRRQYMKSHSWIMTVMALAAFSCVLYIGFDAVYDRLATLRNINQYENRLQILKDLLRCFRLFPVLGTGLGTHSVVYPMFDSSSIIELASHAENEYAQAMEETGIVGLGSLVIFGIIIWTGYLKSIHGKPAICSAAYGLGMGLLAILIQSLSDFGQHLPSNAFLSAIFCALLLGLTNTGKENKPATRSVTIFWRRRSLGVVILLVVSSVWAWAIISANDARIAENHWQKAVSIERSLAKQNWQGTYTEFTDLIVNASAATNYLPKNIRYRYWLNVYRLYSISRTDPNTGAIFVPDDSIPLVYDITDDLNKTISICPTFGAAYCVLGQIEKLIFDEPSGAEKIKKGYRLAPCDPVTCFTAGLLDIEENKIDQSFAKFRKAAQLDGQYFEKAVDIYIKVNRPDLAVAIADNDVRRLSYVAGTLAGIDGHKELVNSAYAKATELLKEKCSQPDAPDWAFALLANIYEKQQCNQMAVEYYRHALALNYGHVHWRLALAKLLAKTQKISEAMNEARICLRIRPQFEEAEKLIGDLSVNPAAFGKEIESP
jgi:tetratricopeptide (TPR) repeat protein/O-antigen ligase